MANATTKTRSTTTRTRSTRTAEKTTPKAAAKSATKTAAAKDEAQTRDQLVVLATELQVIAGLKSKFEAQEKKLKEQIAGITNHEATNLEFGDDFELVVTPKGKVDNAKLAEAYPAEDFPEYWTAKISADEVKKAIGENEYSRYQIPSTTAVTVKQK